MECLCQVSRKAADVLAWYAIVPGNRTLNIGLEEVVVFVGPAVGTTVDSDAPACEGATDMGDMHDGGSETLLIEALQPRVGSVFTERVLDSKFLGGRGREGFDENGPCD